MYLKDGTLLQGGKYRIIRLLGQGGFGITYEAEHTMFRQKVAVKEFFMKDICNRDEETCGVSVPSLGSRELVEKFRVKFIKEAQLLWSLNHPHIVRVLDVFEENATAYYVMELVPGGSLKGMIVKNGPLSEAVAEGYVRQVADALAYIHSRHTVHLDVKPSNILLRTPGDVVLIDFGISKHYDQAGGQTSSTPVGLSKGFAPMEQGRDGDVSQFKPSTDIYALGATLYYLLSGTVPPEASIIAEDGLPRPDGISDRMWAVIEKSMKPFRKDRPQDINAFLSLLDSPVWEPEPRLDKEPYEEETEWNETVLEVKPEPSPIEEKSFPVFTEVFLWLSSIIGAAVVLFLISAVCAFFSLILLVALITEVGVIMLIAHRKIGFWFLLVGGLACLCAFLVAFSRYSLYEEGLIYVFLGILAFIELATFGVLFIKNDRGSTGWSLLF